MEIRCRSREERDADGTSRSHLREAGFGARLSPQAACALSSLISSRALPIEPVYRIGNRQYARRTGRGRKRSWPSPIAGSFLPKTVRIRTSFAQCRLPASTEHHPSSQIVGELSPPRRIDRAESSSFRFARRGFSRWLTARAFAPFLLPVARRADASAQQCSTP